MKKTFKKCPEFVERILFLCKSYIIKVPSEKRVVSKEDVSFN